MTMGRYEEVRDRATEVMTQQAMANAAMQAEKLMKHWTTLQPVLTLLRKY